MRSSSSTLSSSLIVVRSSSSTLSSSLITVRSSRTSGQRRCSQS